VPRSISGQVRNDADNDGDLADTETGIGGVTIELFATDSNGAPTGSALQTVTTDANTGNYVFNNVSPGNYIVVETDLSGYSSTNDASTPNDNQIPVTVLAVNITGRDFLDRLLPVTNVPNLLLVKRITAINGGTVTTGTGDDLSTYRDDALDPYDDNDPTVPAPTPADTIYWPTPLNTSLRGGIDGGNVRSNDIIDYTIYFLSTGAAIAQDVLICDYVPADVTFLNTAYNSSPAPHPSLTTAGLNRGIVVGTGVNGTVSLHALTNAGDSDPGYYFPAGTDPATTFPGLDCDGDNIAGNNNLTGAIVVNLGDIPHAIGVNDPANSYGFIRFRATVE
jgi:uncharacterized repeat protein (TIGR01451 family)